MMICFSELRNPFPPTAQNSKSKTITEGSQSREIEMQEMEPSQTLNTPKTPKAATITMEVSSASSTPGLEFYPTECTSHIALHFI